MLSWRLAARRDLTLTLAAFNLALMRRKPAAGLIFHSDRGIEYGAYGYRAAGRTRDRPEHESSETALCRI